MVSIIIPTYNRENTIARAVNSVLNQTYTDIEVIIVDDCSSDNTRKIIENIKDNRLHYYVLEKNSGACFARNFGIEKSKGDYIAFQDSDDEWYPTKLEEQLKNMAKNNSQLDFCSFISINDSDKKVLPTEKTIKKINKYGFNKSLAFGNYIGTPLLVLKKECVDNHRFDNSLPRFQDWDFVLKLTEEYNVSFTNKVLANTYIQSNSITKSNEKLFKSIEIMSNKNYKNKNIVLYTLNCILAKNNKEKRRFYYKKALKHYFSIKTLIKYLINY